MSKTEKTSVKKEVPKPAKPNPEKDKATPEKEQ